MEPYRRHPAVLLGGGYNAVSAARSLGRAGCRVHLGLDAAGAGFPAASRWATSSFRPSATSTAPQEWLDWLAGLHADDGVVIPCSDPALELVAAHRADLVALGLHPAEADDRLVRSLLDKQTTYALAEQVGVRTPRTAAVTGLSQALEAAAGLPLPFAVKPRVSHRFLRSGQRTPKAVVVHRREDLEPLLRRVIGQGFGVLLTEIVPGVDEEYRSYNTYVDAEGRRLLHLTKRKLRQHPVGFGSGTFHVTDHDPEVAALGTRLFDALGLRGIGNVEVKRDARDGSLVLIECNLRLTAAVELLRRAGADVTDVVYRRALGLPVEPVDGYRDGVRQWLPLHDALAARELRAQGRLTARAWVGQVARPRTTLPVWEVTDPGPSRSLAAATAGRTVVRALGGTPGERLLQAALARGGAGGRLGRAALAEVGVLVGAGPRAYRGRWVDRAPLSTVPAGRSALYRTYWEQAASLVGARVEDLGRGVLRLHRGGASTTVWDSLVALDDPLVLAMAGDKPTARARLQEAGLPVGEQVVCSPRELVAAQRLLDSAGAVVVKPARSGGGNGVTCGVRTPAELTAAFTVALRASDRVVVEPQVAGTELRLLVLSGRVVGTVRRRPPSLVGDGRSSIGELIATENARRRLDPALGLYPIGVDLDLVFTLRRSGRGLGTVPAAGEQVLVKTAVNENGAHDNDVVPSPPHVAAAAVAAARALGSELAAVEVITPDVTVPLAQAGGIVVEVNTTPGLHYHYTAGGAGDVPVAAAVLEHLLTRSAAGAPERVLSPALPPQPSLDRVIGLP